MSALLFVPLDQFQQANIYRYRENGWTLYSFVPFNIYCIGILGVFGVIIAIFSTMYAGHLVMVPFYAVTLAVTIYLSGTLRGIANNLDYRWLAVAFGIADSVLRVVFLYAYSRLFTPHPEDILLTTSLAGAVVAAGMISIFSRLNIWGGGEMKQIYPRDFFKFAWPISVGAGLNWIQIHAARFLVPLGFTQTIGIYGTVSAVGVAGMTSAGSVVQTIFMPELYKTYGRSMKKYIGLVVSMIVFVFIVSIFIARPLISLLTEPKFVPFSYCVLFGIVIEGGSIILGGLGAYLQIHHRTDLGLGVGIIGFLASLIPIVTLYHLQAISPFSLGISAIFAQFTTVVYMFVVYFRLRRSHEQPA